MEKRNQYGLIGKNISYSFSKGHFTKKFSELDIADCSYENFDLENIDEFPMLIQANPSLKGLNVTIPYKESIIPLLDKLSKKAVEISAVNTIKFTKKGKLKGYNTDWFGFKKSLKPLLKSHHKKALILGTGGASRAVAYALQGLGIPYVFVSRNPLGNMMDYTMLNAGIFNKYHIVINCTPVGTSPNINNCPDIPYELLTSKHIAFDLIYNPEETLFLKKAKRYGAKTKNGYGMLVFQAEKAWKIWAK
jgi:shikimate dehydrogenase